MGAKSIDDDRIHGATADTNNLPPQYPPGAGARGEHGIVGVRLHVDELGLVTRVDIVQSSGFPRLDRAAQVALRAWHFKAAERDGHAVPDLIEINVSFELQ